MRRERRSRQLRKPVRARQEVGKILGRGERGEQYLYIGKAARGCAGLPCPIGGTPNPAGPTPIIR